MISTKVLNCSHVWAKPFVYAYPNGIELVEGRAFCEITSSRSSKKCLFFQVSWLDGVSCGKKGK